MRCFPVACFLADALLVAVLAGCGAPTSVAPSTQNEFAFGHSRMSPGVKGRRLLYVSNTFGGTVNVYLDSTWNPVGELLGFSRPSGMCVDAAQDVYVTDDVTLLVTEYAHGAITATRRLADHQGDPLSCAVDVKTGDLAVANVQGPSEGPGNVIVYKGAKGSPVKYTANGFTFYFSVAYDENDDLFICGLGSSTTYLAELPKGKSAFKVLTSNQPIGGLGGLAWDGTFLAVGDEVTSTIYQFAIKGSKALVKGSTELNGATTVFQFSFDRGNSRPQATTVIGADSGAGAVDKWDYPAGGTPLRTITGLDAPEGVVVSQ